MEKLTKISARLLFFIITIAFILFPLANGVHSYEEKYEMRTSLLHRDDIKTFNYFLLGDSVFCSFYINNENNSIWNKFKYITGYELLPGALNGARIGDYVNSANYMSKKLQENSTVFIDITPTRFISRDKNEKNNYDQQFADLEQENNFKFYKYINYFDNKYLEFMLKYLKNNKTDRNIKEHYNRVWNIDGDFAKKRYLSTYKNIIKMSQYEDMRALKEINEIFIEKKIKTIFVLTPLNKELLYTYSDISTADKIYSNLRDTHDNTKKYLSTINATTIDLFDKVPDMCFADLLHTNTCGDEIIARSLADYALTDRGRPL